MDKNSHRAFGLVKNCYIAVSMSNSPKCGVVSKFIRSCHEKNDMAQSNRIFVFLTPWRNHDNSHFWKIVTSQNHVKSQQKITTKIIAISRDLIQFWQKINMI